MEMFRINALSPSVKYPTLSPTIESRPLSPKFFSNFKPKKESRKLESSMKQSTSIKQVPGLSTKTCPLRLISPSIKKRTQVYLPAKNEISIDHCMQV